MTARLAEAGDLEVLISWMCHPASWADQTHSEAICNAAFAVVVRGGQRLFSSFPLHIRRLLVIAQRDEA